LLALTEVVGNAPLEEYVNTPFPPAEFANACRGALLNAELVK
jgi:hypothetical protein